LNFLDKTANLTIEIAMAFVAKTTTLLPHNPDDTVFISLTTMQKILAGGNWDHLRLLPGAPHHLTQSDRGVAV